MIDRILSLFAWWGLSLGATASAQDMATMFAQYAQLDAELKSRSAPVMPTLRWQRDVTFSKDLPVKDGKATTSLALDLLHPADSISKPRPLVLFVHGGGWSRGNRSMGEDFLPLFAGGGAVAGTLSYRLAGEAPYPAALQDVAAAVAWIRANADPLGVDPNRIAIWGHSAGAHLAIHTAVFDPDRAQGIRCAVGVAGPYDLLLEEDASPFGEMMVRNFLRDPADPLGMAEGAEDAIRARAREASPVNHLDRADPPLLLIQGGKDSLCASAQARDMAAAAMKAGTEVHLAFYPEIGHVPTDPDVFRTISRFMDRHLGTSCSAFFDSIWPIEQVVATATEPETKE